MKKINTAFRVLLTIGTLSLTGCLERCKKKTDTTASTPATTEEKSSASEDKPAESSMKNVSLEKKGAYGPFSLEKFHTVSAEDVTSDSGDSMEDDEEEDSDEKREMIKRFPHEDVIPPQEKF